MDEMSHKDGQESLDRNEIFSKAVRAGKRTYFFDVKSTRRNDYYLTITESKKRVDQEGDFSFEKHKIFLYKEDFDKFAEGLMEVVEYIRKNQQDELPSHDMDSVEILQNDLSNINFEDLES